MRQIVTGRRDMVAEHSRHSAYTLSQKGHAGRAAGRKDLLSMYGCVFIIRLRTTRARRRFAANSASPERHRGACLSAMPISFHPGEGPDHRGKTREAA
jgi:hypothetical protein